MHPDQEFAEEYTKSEAIRFIVIAMLAGALVVIFSKSWLFPWLREFATSAPCRKVMGIEGLTVLWYGLFVGIPLSATVFFIAALGWRGYKILRDGQVPPLNEKVYRPTRIRRGFKAKMVGYIHMLAFLPPLALTIWGGFQADELSSTTLSKAKVDACEANPAFKLDSPRSGRAP